MFEIFSEEHFRLMKKFIGLLMQILLDQTFWTDW